MSLNIGELLLELAIEYALGAALVAARQALQPAPAGRPGTVVAPPAGPPARGVLSHVPGRVRLPVDGVHGDARRAAAVEAALGTCPGIVRASASALTGNALVHYDPGQISVAQICAAIAHGLATSPENGTLATGAV